MFTKFDYKQFVETIVIRKPVHIDPQPQIMMQGIKPAAVALLADYYKLKYSCNFELTTKTYVTSNDYLVDIPVFFEKFRAEIAEQKEKLKASSKTGSFEHRKTFIISREGHAIPLSFLYKYNHENQQGNEILFIANSLGDQCLISTESIRTRMMLTLSFLLKGSLENLEIYFVEKQRQADYGSCYNDAVVFARDITRKDHSGAYKFANLIDMVIESRKKTHTNLPRVYYTMLPAFLLKTVQILAFFDEHYGALSDVHKAAIINIRKSGSRENIQSFRSRFLYEITQGQCRTIRNIYLQSRTAKMVKKLELQYYKLALERHFDKKMTMKDFAEFQAAILLLQKTMQDTYEYIQRALKPNLQQTLDSLCETCTITSSIARGSTIVCGV